MIESRYDRVPPAIVRLPMPTLMRAGPYRLFMFMFDCTEPPHVHVDGNDGLAKFWLRSVSLADSLGYSPREISRIRAVVMRERMSLIRGFVETCERARP
jgi:Domain of unknown function (DUF4160)